MITVGNLADLLINLGFEKKNEKYIKHFSAFNVQLEADFAQKKLIYPEIMKGRDRNTNFYKDNGQENKENFVVFECVNRLLEKGYRPEDIELEKVWSLGHNAKSGRADICVTDKDGSMLFIIECKTYGKEYDKAFNDTINDGAQLFSYWQQEHATKWLVLYASDFTDDKVLRYNAPTINCSDDANIILLAEKDKSIYLYKNAHTAYEKHNVWKRTYESKWQKDLIFSDDTVAYNIGVKPLLKRDLQDFTPEDKIVNRFEEILRHNNVSDKENAFNRLTALFICKLVDEINKDDDSEVEFQYKQGTDTYETLQDRLQRLHRDGMDKFMHEPIFYVDVNYPKWLFEHYTGQNRAKAIADLEKTIRSLKFYSNNDFAFKDVHNEELFYQNGKILVEMVQLFEKYRIVYNGKHQFLGDLFEQLLNKGFKQDEGQFFTPTPITRFIWDCLPVKNYLESYRSNGYPKIVDYACGAGHFLTEAVETINHFTNNKDDNSWVRDHIYGIEKDYRLARVAKIAMYMNGAGESNIIFGDGLENNKADGIENGIFDILVANPPYSVKDFKQHLQLKNNNFELLNTISDNGGEIETLFVERISQLLKPNGIAAVILPSSILSNNSSSYIGAREQILKNFMIRGIVSLGSKAFGATGTNTVIMFLEKYNESPKKVDLLTDTVKAIFSGSDLSGWKDKELLIDYCTQIEVLEEDYKKFINMEFDSVQLAEHDYFKIYVTAFNESTQLKELRKKSAYKRKSTEEQQADYFELLYKFIFEVEREKLLYFALVNKQRTVIIKSPTENKEQVKFLGYDWSNRKGKEGIIINQPAGGMMYVDEDREAEYALAALIRANYQNKVIDLPEDSKEVSIIVETEKLLDFTKSAFNKSISNSVTKNKIELQSAFKITKVGSLADVRKGTAITKAETTNGPYKVVAGGKTSAYTHTVYNRDEDVITVSASGANAGYVNFWGEKIFASDCTTVQCNNKTSTLYVYYYLKCIQDQIYEVLQKGAGQPHVYAEDVKDIPIPDVDIKLQKEIVTNCQAIDGEYNSTRMSEELYRSKIKEVFNAKQVIVKSD